MDFIVSNVNFSNNLVLNEQFCLMEKIILYPFLSFPLFMQVTSFLNLKKQLVIGDSHTPHETT